MSETVYTVLAYKPDSDNYCMNCHMESYPSDFQFKVCGSEQEAVEFAALFVGHVCRHGESGYDVVILVNGKDGSYPYCDIAARRILDSAGALRKQREGEAEELAAREKEKAKIAHKKSRENAKKAKALAGEARDRKEFARLKAKYEGKDGKK